MRTKHLELYPESEWNQNAGSSPLYDELSVVELKVIVQDNLICFFHTIQPVVAEEQDVELEVGSLLLSLDV